MRIFIRDNNKKITIPAPFWLIEFGIRIAGSRLILRTVPPDSRQYVEMIDFKKLSEGFKVLKNYKGLVLVHVISKSGEEVKITI
jgi:hypothetical protein